MNDALERKKRFLQLKEEAGGDVEKMQEIHEQFPYRVYFDQYGNIMCFTNDYSIIPKEHWQTEDFTQDQLSILIDADLSKFRIKQDTKQQNVWCIEPKPLESVVVQADSDFMSRVGYEDPDNADILLNVGSESVSVRLHPSVKEQYSDIYPISATVNGHRLLKFYFTTPGDPHTLFHYEVITLADLLVNDKVTFTTNLDFRLYGLYTQKLFDTYSRQDI